MGKDKQRLPDAAREGQSLHQARVQRKRCTAKEPCGQYYAIDANGARIERMPEQSFDPLTVVDSPYVTMQKLTDRWEISVDGYPPLSSRFLAFVDVERGTQGTRALEVALQRFFTAYPILAVLVVQSLDAGRSGRDMGEETGLSQPTVASILFRARELLRTMLSEELVASA